MTKKKYLIMLIACFVLLLAGCSSTEPATEEGKVNEETVVLEEVTFVLDWLPNTNHTGVYTALEKGFYEEEGIKLNIIQPAETDVNSLIATNQGQFGVSFQEQVTYARTAKNPLPIKAVATIIQHNTSGFASPEDKGIETPSDFEGKKYGSWGTDLEDAFLKTLMEKEGADFSKLEILNLQSYDFFTSVRENVDFQWIYYGWDGIAAEVQDFPLNFIKLQDVDSRLDFYTPVIITNEVTIDENPEMIRKFLKATSKGYEYAIENPEESVTYLLKYSPETDKEIALASQKYLADEYISDASQWGIMKPEIWENFGNWMEENNLLESSFNSEEAYTNEFLPEQE